MTMTMSKKKKFKTFTIESLGSSDTIKAFYMFKKITKEQELFIQENLNLVKKSI
jgi:hypothetical protein